MPLRVALVGSGTLPIPPDGYGAVEKYLWNVARRLPDHGVEPEIVNEVVGSSSAAEYRWALRARRRVQELDVDLVHVHTTGVGATFSFLGPPYVYTSHSRHWVTVDGLTDRLGLRLDRRALSRAQATIALNRDMARRIREATGADPAVVPTGVDVDAYGPDPEARTGDKVAALGAVIRDKRLTLAAEALEPLDCTFHIVGPLRDDAAVDELRAYDEDDVVLHGPVPEEEVQSFLAGSDVFVHPSVAEGLSMAVLEAMASGLPLVASDICVGQVVDGENGVAIPTHAPDGDRVQAIRDAARRLLGDPDLRSRYGERSREIAVERYSWDAVAEGTAAVYRDVLDDA